MTEYYVATDGSDSNSGTKDSPFGTVHEGVTHLGAGDVLYIRGGIYDYADGNPVQVRGVQGTESNPIRIEGYPGEDVVLRWPGGSNGGTYGGGGLEFFENCQWWEVRNLRVTGSTDVGIFAEDSAHFLFEDLQCVNNGNSGLAMQWCDDAVYRNVDSWDNDDLESNNGENADGIVFAFGTGVTIENCRMWNNSDDGLDLWEAKEGTVRNCEAWSNGYGTDGDGHGFKLGGIRPGDVTDQYSGDFVVQNCVAYSNRLDGFADNGASNLTVQNNTAFDNRFGVNVEGDGQVVQNNLAWQNANGENNTNGDADDNHNSWNMGSPDPEFVSTDPNDPEFLRLSSSSPYIDAGTDVGLPFNGDAPDIGAYETGSSDTTSGTKVNDGSGWRSVTVYYHDGDSFTSA